MFELSAKLFFKIRILLIENFIFTLHGIIIYFSSFLFSLLKPLFNLHSQTIRFTPRTTFVCKQTPNTQKKSSTRSGACTGASTHSEETKHNFYFSLSFLFRSTIIIAAKPSPIAFRFSPNTIVAQNKTDENLTCERGRARSAGAR
jgi:hypothetical protein